MKRLAPCLILFVLVGCNKPQKPTPVPLTEAQIYANLWAKCKAKHLAYSVYCFDGCNADAWDDQYTWLESRFLVHGSYYQFHSDPVDGPGHGGPTEAAQMLLNGLDSEPNVVRSPDNAPHFMTGDVNPNGKID